jgi:transposase-like protein
MSGSSERRRRRKFTDEVKADAVTLVEESGGQTAKEPGIYDRSKVGSSGRASSTVHP